jgi:GT2 family glycosyltransferase
MTTAIIICYNEEIKDIQAAIDSLNKQTEPPEEIVLVDNSKDLRFQAISQVKYLPSDKNLGFAKAVNIGASEAQGDYIFLLNPDARAKDNALELLKDVLIKTPAAVITGGQIVLPDNRVNAGDNPIHLSGLSWAGNYLGQKEIGGARKTLSVSGAAMLIKKDYFLKSGGFHPAIFMYYDDSDLCWRTNLQGQDVLFVPEAEVIHDYDFNKGLLKWQFLEEGRLISILTNYQKKTLVLLFPALIGTELAIILFAIKSGWFKYKLKAYFTLVKKRKAIIKMRRAVQSRRTRSDEDLIDLFSTDLNSPVLNHFGLKITRPIFKIYQKIIKLI